MRYINSDSAQLVFNGTSLNRVDVILVLSQRYCKWGGGGGGERPIVTPSPLTINNLLVYAPGGGSSICMHIGYVPQKRLPFSALNFRSGAYNFQKFPQKSVPEHHQFTFFGGFCRSGDHHFPNFFNFNPFIASHGRLSPYAAPRVSQTRPGSSGESHFHAKTDQARSGDPHFHARPGARSGALANFSLWRGTWPKFGVSTPPPPPRGGLRLSLTHKTKLTKPFQDV